MRDRRPGRRSDRRLRLKVRRLHLNVHRLHLDVFRLVASFARPERPFGSLTYVTWTSSSSPARASTTSRTSRSRSRANALWSSPGCPAPGKSSLAFDTIYAEGQRRYVESLSAYARQFLGQMDKPDVDSIEGLSPAISIDQKTTSRNPRSTVGTVTEIYDYLRLLWARVGHPHCPRCGRADRRPVGRADHRPGDGACPRARASWSLAPIVRGRKGEYGKQLEELRARGLRAREGRRRAAPTRRGDRPRQEVQTRHRRRRRPARDEAANCASGSPTRSRRPSRWRTGSSRSSWSTTTAIQTFSEKFACLE